MKKIYGLFLGYMLFISLGMACLWELFGFVLAYCIEGFCVLRQYPRYLPFCLVCGLVGFIGVIFVASANAKLSKKIIWSKWKGILLFSVALLISIPIAKCWLDLFWILQCRF